MVYDHITVRKITRRYHTYQYVMEEGGQHDVKS